MTRKIAITCRVTEATGYLEKRDSLAHDWFRYFSDNFKNDILIPIPNLTSDINRFMIELKVDAVILSGGDDIGKDPVRDDFEFKLIDYCVEKSIPVLGVCRGMQMINKKYGGDLVEVGPMHVKNSHAVKVDHKDYQVNSFHKFGINKDSLAKKFDVFAVADDQTIEGMRSTDLKLTGVMWHPERQGAALDLDLFIFKKFLFGGSQ